MCSGVPAGTEDQRQSGWMFAGQKNLADLSDLSPAHRHNELIEFLLRLIGLMVS